MNVRILTGSEIDEAQKLACEVLVWEQDWIIPENPTGLRVEGDRLRDAYDPIATWFGIFDGNALIGCHRICGRLHGSFELERYHPLPDFIERSNSAVEGTRLAVKKEGLRKQVA